MKVYVKFLSQIAKKTTEKQKLKKTNVYVVVPYEPGYRAIFRGGAGGATAPPDVFNLLQIQRQIYKITGHLNLDRTSRVTYVHV